MFSAAHTSTRSFHTSTPALLKRPWKTYKDGTLFYGQSKAGNKRLSLSTKQGNKNFYKGTRSSGIGHISNKGKYTIDYQKVRTFVTPADMSTPLKPLVSANVPIPKNTFKGYTGITDGRLWLNKVKEYIETGDVQFEKSDTYVEKY
ncbi:hypothetical protein C6P40_003781 [Pichia californica]|uniref:54S ribosomal protein L27, mitochondrial n=1 Tax=Pichia californica TaxID=460514 RepID=A0A9P6WG80_9ASCO|nr:hypothetical protein C6P42_003580 [[Candida] californica]KAG0686575.1 hypothetical protein C6P40_003781 [[Candida] californica]